MSTALEIASPVMVCGWFFIAFARTFCAVETVEEDQ